MPTTPCKRDGFRGFASDLQIIYPKGDHLLIYPTKIGPLHQFTEKALHWRAYIFGGNGSP